MGRKGQNVFHERERRRDMVRGREPSAVSEYDWFVNVQMTERCRGREKMKGGGQFTRGDLWG